MSYDPFSELFPGDDAATAPDPNRSPEATSPAAPTSAPLTRREALARTTTIEQPQPYQVDPARAPLAVEPERRTRRRAWPWVLLGIVVVLALVGTWGWTTYGAKIQSALGIAAPIDYTGSGTGEVLVTIQSGDIGSDVAKTLAQAGVVKTYQSFYKLLLVQDPQVPFFPGTYKLAKGMSAQAALTALQDPANKLVQTVLVPEGKSIGQTFELLAAGTGLTVDDFTTAAADVTAYGVDPAAPSLEGYLFPARYTFDPGLDAHAILQQMVNRTFDSLDKAGVAPADRLKVLTLASIIQRESGSNTDDFYKVSRVFHNRLETPGWKLQSDATVAYGTGKTSTVWTTDAERADASNPYNTYVHAGLPIGPIGAAGDLAIDAALHPADGSWFFFVPVNLATGETVFSTTAAEHDAAVAQLHAWCKASAENAAYCD